MKSEAQQPVLDDLRARLATIERAVDESSYRPGPWQALTRDIRRSRLFERAAIAEDVSRVSRKLHLRRRRRHMPVSTGIWLELIATIVGGLLMTSGVELQSNLLAFLGALFWMVAFEPLVKLSVGQLMGVRYEYFYLSALEPRLKMRFGTYLARPRPARIITHLFGTVGSPLAAYLSFWMLSQAVPGAAALCYGAFWVAVSINLVGFFAPLLGFRRIGPIPLSMSSAGSAATEIREGAGRS